MRRYAMQFLLVAPFAMALVGHATSADLYTTRTITSGTAPERRAIGFAQCLRDVVVRVTGDSRLLADPSVEAQAKHAGDLIAGHTFRDRMGGIPIHDEQGSYDRPHDLTCVFDAARLDMFLKSLGRTPWLERPRIVAVVAVHDMKGAESMLASDSSGQRDLDMRSALMAAAEKPALPLALPTQAELSKAGLDAVTVAEAGPDRLDELTRAAGADIAITGTVVWSDKALGWVADWRIVGKGLKARWGISGVGFDDAFRNAVAGTAQLLSGNGAPADAR